MTVVMDMGWIVTFAADQSVAPQISIATEGGSGTPVPDLSIEVDDLPDVHQRILVAGFRVEYGPLTEPWGVTRFAIRSVGWSMSWRTSNQPDEAGSDPACLVAGLLLEINEASAPDRSCPQAPSRCDAGETFPNRRGNHASFYSRNPCRCDGDLFQRARRCIGADCNNSKRRSSFCRTFDPRHFNCHELHDVLQLAVGELPNTLRLAHTAGRPSQPQQ
jgi:hypothetical protein